VKEILLKIALIGATGRVGSRLLTEAVNRGHDVTAIMRNPEKLPLRERVRVAPLDVNDTKALAEIIKGHDAIVHALNPFDGDSAATRTDNQRQATASIVAAAKLGGIRRLVAVGGAGTLKHEGLRFMDHADFPAAWRGGAQATAVVNELLYKESDLDWTILSPSHWFRPGQRTGQFRLGLDDLLIPSSGESRISIEDYAIALIDELEQPQHIQCRFTVGY
jgi:putative NADH-flavin reductase